MVLTYYGAGFVKVTQGDLVIAFNPIGKASGLKTTRFGADLALSSLHDPAYRGLEEMSFGTREPFIIDGPGEYEIGGTFVRGFVSVGPRGLINTIYCLNLEGMNLCHLGGLADPNIAPEVIEQIGTIDILFLPIGGGDTLNSHQAQKLAASLEPKLIVPVGYDPESKDDVLKLFLKEAGETNGAPVDKLTLKKKDLEGHEADIVVIQSQ